MVRLHPVLASPRLVFTWQPSFPANIKIVCIWGRARYISPLVSEARRVGKCTCNCPQVCGLRAVTRMRIIIGRLTASKPASDRRDWGSRTIPSRLSHRYLPLWVRMCEFLDLRVQSPAPRIPLQFASRPEQHDAPLRGQWWDRSAAGWALCFVDLGCGAGCSLVAGTHGVRVVPQHEQCILLRIVSLQPVCVPTCHCRRVRFKLPRREHLSRKVTRTHIGVD